MEPYNLDDYCSKTTQHDSLQHHPSPELFKRPTRFQAHQFRKNVGKSGNRPDPENKIGYKADAPLANNV